MMLIAFVDLLDRPEDFLQGREGDKPWPVGKMLLNPVSWVMTGRPAARYCALRSLDQPLRKRPFRFLATVNSPRDGAM